jgi:hypothetical protein
LRHCLSLSLSPPCALRPLRFLARAARRADAELSKAQQVRQAAVDEVAAVDARTQKVGSEIRALDARKLNMLSEQTSLDKSAQNTKVRRAPMCVGALRSRRAVARFAESAAAPTDGPTPPEGGERAGALGFRALAPSVSALNCRARTDSVPVIPTTTYPHRAYSVSRYALRARRAA